MVLRLLFIPAKDLPASVQVYLLCYNKRHLLLSANTLNAKISDKDSTICFVFCQAVKALIDDKQI